jgi:hypothetical protein
MLASACHSVIHPSETADAASHATSDAPHDAASASGPISAPDDTWTWVDFPESRCASGTATGIGVNPHAGATQVMVFFEGGGWCSDGTTCWGTKPAAANLTGYDASNFASDSAKN